mmetsp:Transcript_35405/g.31255  ORF Transcript_35405/g.31255 Transcript_35405/m.31255 type:complete len:88 (+) Transcript_35405:151-414(+)
MGRRRKYKSKFDKYHDKIAAIKILTWCMICVWILGGYMCDNDQKELQSYLEIFSNAYLCLIQLLSTFQAKCFIGFISISVFGALVVI